MFGKQCIILVLHVITLLDFILYCCKAQNLLYPVVYIWAHVLAKVNVCNELSIHRASIVNFISDIYSEILLITDLAQ